MKLNERIFSHLPYSHIIIVRIRGKFTNLSMGKAIFDMIIYHGIYTPTLSEHSKIRHYNN